VHRIYLATLNTFRGLSHAGRTEAAVRQELIVLAIALPLGLWAAPSAAWYVAMIGALFVVLAIELLNTAIEKLCDHVSPEWRSNIGLIKDYGSASVFFGLCLVGLVWLVALAVRFGFL
jgi:diacylglycerol kinase (ATP)